MIPNLEIKANNNINENENHYLNQPINNEEFYVNIPIKKHKSTPGTDEITYHVIYHLPYTARKILTKSFNEILTTGKIPKEWKKFTIIPIIKPNKLLGNAENYRPIAITSCCRKIYEKIITKRIIYCIERNSLWPKTQFGFRPGYGTYDNLTILTVDILNAFLDNDCIEATFIDLHKAFDSVNIQILIHELNKYNMNGHILLSIKELITNRIITIKYKNQYTSSRITSQGIPQGTPLSPLLYIIYTKQSKKYPSMQECYNFQMI